MSYVAKSLAGPVVASRTRRRRRGLGIGLVLAALIGLAALHNVPSALTAEDRAAIARILAEGGHSALAEANAARLPFDEQMKIVAAAQDAVLTIAPDEPGIAFDRTREPKDLYELRHGLCFDRARAIEKTLAHLGLKTRYAAIYSTAASGSALRSLVTPGVPSHAIVEVSTERGWMAIDSNIRWFGLTADSRPIDLATLRSDPKLRDAGWHALVKQPLNPILRDGFTYVFGLYSRHGRFYPPYTPIPDVSWPQLAYNFSD